MSTENRMGWGNEIDSFVKIYMFQMGKIVYDWATGIMNREGKIIDKIDEQIASVEKEIKEKTALDKKLKDKIESLEKASSKSRMEWQKLIDEASRYKTVANKYIIEKMNLEKLEKGSREYKSLETRLKGFEQKYKKWKETVVRAEQKKEEYQDLYSQFVEAKGKMSRYDVGKLSLLQYVSITLVKRLKNLKKEKELLEGATAINMGKHRDELVKAFSNQRTLNDISGMIVNAIDTVLQGQLYSDEFSEDELMQFVEEIFMEVSRDKVDRFNFLRTLAEDKKNYTVVAINGKPVKVFDMDKISTDDMIRVFSGWFRESILMTVSNVLKKMKKKQLLFVPEQIKTDDDEESSLYEMVDSNDGGMSILDEGKSRKTRGISEENIVNQSTKDLWKDVEIYLNRNTDKMAEVINNALQRQLPPNAYFRKIGAQKAKMELLPIVKKIVHSCGNEIRNGSFMASTKLRNFVKTAIGGVEDGNIFNTIYTIIRAALEYYIASYLGKSILESVRKMQQDEASSEIAFLRALEKRKDMSKQALRDCRLVKYASKTHQIASNLVADEYEDPEEMIEKLSKEDVKKELSASYQIDRKVNFLLEDKSFPDSVGKYNNQIGGQSKHVPGQYGA